MRTTLYILLLAGLTNCQHTPVKKQVAKGDRVVLAFKIKNTDNVRLDESFFHDDFDNITTDELFSFVAGHQEVINGWDSVIIGCKPDTIYTFTIPYQQAYREENIYHDIPPKSDLILTFKIFYIQ